MVLPPRECVSPPDQLADPLAGSPPVAILAGATASGKSSLALDLAEQLPDLELVSADSIQVYRGFDIGSAKPSQEERKRVLHHLIDLKDPEETFTAADFVREAKSAIDRIHSRGKRALIVGGTGFYLKALVFGLWDAPPTDPVLRAELGRIPLDALVEELRTKDPALLETISANDRYRVTRAVEILRLGGEKPSLLASRSGKTADPRFRILFLDREDADLESRIRARAEEMLSHGLLEEAERLRNQHPRAKALGSVGYAEALAFLDQKPPASRKLRPGSLGLIDEIALATRKLVKQQRTFFHGEKQLGGANPQVFLLDRDREKARSLLLRIYS